MGEAAMALLRCHQCGCRAIGEAPEALPAGWTALFVNCWYGRGGGMARPVLPLHGEG